MAVSPVHEPSMLKKSYRLVRNMLPDEIAIRLTYLLKTKQMLNLKSPKTFNEKMQWLKLYYHNPLLTQLADKYAVRDYVKAKIGEQYLTKLYGVWHSSNDIVFSELPNEFVLKATHASGTNILCRDKSKLDWDACCKEMAKWMNFDFYRTGREWAYKNIAPKIIAEELLVENDGSQLKDFKVLCFNGNPKLIWVDIDRFSNHRRNFYDLNWAFQPNKRIEYPNAPDVIIEKPYNLDEMIAAAQKLSIGLPHVRVDLYSVNSKRLVFGEMTFYSGNGEEHFSPREFAMELGCLLELPSELVK